MLPEAQGGRSDGHDDTPIATPIYGLMAEFDDPSALVAAAAARARRRATARMDAYSPFPIEELTEALGLAPHAAAADRADRRPRRRRRRLLAAVLGRRRSPIRSTSAAGR